HGTLTVGVHVLTGKGVWQVLYHLLVLQPRAGATLSVRTCACATCGTVCAWGAACHPDLCVVEMRPAKSTTWRPLLVGHPRTVGAGGCRHRGVRGELVLTGPQVCATIGVLQQTPARVWRKLAPLLAILARNGSAISKVMPPYVDLKVPSCLG